MNKTTLYEISAAGVLAPSADNSLEFYFDYQDSAIDIWAQSGFEFSAVRHRRVLDLLAFGAIVENMCLKATEFSLQTMVQWFPAANKRLVARLEFISGAQVVTDFLCKSIQRRQTNRHVFYKGHPTDAQKARLSEQVSRNSDARVVWLEGENRRKAQSLIWLAESERFLSAGLHSEMFSSIRFDLNWRDSADYGLPPGALEVEKFMRPMFKVLRYWPLMRAMRVLGMHRVLGFRAGLLPCLQAPALGVVMSQASLEEAAVNVGRGFERLWLSATHERLVIQPMAASVVLPLQDDCDHGASRKTRETLKNGWAGICGTDTPLMVFRMGSEASTAAPSVKSLRKPLHTYDWDGLK